MRVDLFDFDLPEERIALRPAEPRDSARLLVVRPGETPQDRVVSDLPSLLRQGDVLVFNDTKVIPAQLKGVRKRGEAMAQVEATLHMRVAPDRWQAFMRPGKRIAAGDRIHFGHDGNYCVLGQLDATVIEKGEAGEALLGFDLSGPIGEIVPASHAGHPSAGKIELTVNGVVRQTSDLAKQIWNVEETIAYLSGLVELQPGDLIFTGTPEGVAKIEPGSTLEGAVAGVGTMRIKIG